MNKERCIKNVIDYRRDNDDYWAKQKLYRINTKLQHILYSCKNTDKRKGFVYNLDQKYIHKIIEQQQYKNKYLGTTINWTADIIDCSSTIDRVDSSIGHCKGNVQIVERWVNRMKLNY